MIYGTNLLNFLVSHAIMKNAAIQRNAHFTTQVYFFLQEAKCTNARIHLLSTANTELRN